jgi:pimeloyl-ACP methyl ester carboxylesterase
VPSPASPRHRFLDANGIRLHLAEWGEDGPPVLLLHGFL